ncbi:cyclase family protein [Streptomyces sp. NPDC046727]|uniref:cyclase family protein n=1 Tax=Streptomyces sp. NPDC046727 TaxID=3155373 RepID=UPI0033FF08CD
MTGLPAAAAASLPGALTGATVVDLSLLVAEDLPCFWSTHQPFQHKTWNWFTDVRSPAGSVSGRGGPYATRWMAIDEHTGTHVDAPTHFIPPEESGLPHAGPAGSSSVDTLPLTQLMGPAAVIDVSALSEEPVPGGTSPLVRPELLADWERSHGELTAGEVVLLRTGWDARYRRGEEGRRYLHDVIVGRTAPGWPAPSVEAMELLLARGVRCVGIDAPSIGAAHDPVPVHVAGLSTGAVYVEGLTGLDRLPPRGAWFCFLPLKIEHGTGAPGRAVALLPAPSE